MENNLLTIAEFSKKANVSVQGIYKRIKNKNDLIQKYIVVKDDQKYIKEIAIQDIYKKSQTKNETEPKTAETYKIIELLERQIETLKKQVEEKNEIVFFLQKQLEEKDKQINSITETLSQQQQLNAIDKQRIELIETKRKKPRFNIFKKRGTIQEKE